MKRFVFKIALFVVLNAALAFAALSIVDSRYHFKQWETDSILLSMPENTRLDLLIMGTSRARILTRVHCNWETFAREFGDSIFNIAVPFGGGIVPEKIYLKNFFREGNSADTILFFVDACMFFAPQPNREHRFVNYEPLRAGFFFDLVTNDQPLDRIATYVESKFSYRWFTLKPGYVGCHTMELKPEDMDPAKMKKRLDSIYFEGLNERYFQKYILDFKDILRMAQERGSRIIIAFAPILLGDQPGMPRLMKELNEYQKEFDFEIHDFTHAIPDLACFCDYDHLNAKGVERLVTECLRPILTQEAK